ncbi:MAG: alanine--tRNA ligase [Methylacidiphilales bacterium]|nr:alanine--tRNA ligase [Candidatus Methylacidiphilales bacterium]MDW8349642.1 alanine--tRNA ligase [Verrucomicrobiae bacterium]
MQSSDVRKSFLDFFAEKQHTIVPSSSLLPDSPNLLFTNAGMNQFVPIFLSQAPCPYRPPRAADTQKCIRAGGKHNDLDDVGHDTYHHTFFEMLGNWSFGDYFKQEAITWAWELLVDRWNFPPHRLFATVYRPAQTEPASFDEEAYAIWQDVFRSAGLDPQVHILFGSKKDNFWMMGDTGPCGPCSEIHVNLLPDREYRPDTGRSLVNSGSPQCIEIWNLVFIQFNATADGSFVPLPSRHVDTGMGFERVCSIIQGTKGFTQFDNLHISNYATDVFREILLAIAERAISSHSQNQSVLQSIASTECILDFERILPQPLTVAFRVIADHLRTLAFAIADGIWPSNEGRGYVLRRILRRAVKFGRVELGIQGPFLFEIVPALVKKFAPTFPELADQESTIVSVIKAEEESFGKTVERGLSLFREERQRLQSAQIQQLSGEFIFRLYDTYGFPYDLTELLAREAHLTMDREGFDRAMEEQRQRSLAAHKRVVIEVNQDGDSAIVTRFIGYEAGEGKGTVLEVNPQPPFVILSETPCYAEMGGQVGDQGTLYFETETYSILDTQKGKGGAVIHLLDRAFTGPKGAEVFVRIDLKRRHRIAAHHTATHLLHWALRMVLGNRVAQRGSYVGPDRLRFDFSHGKGMTPEELSAVERLVTEKIAADDPVQTRIQSYREVKMDPTIMQFFGEKYGDIVRVVDIGGYSKELCGGTHLASTGEAGFFKIVSESAIAAGIRRIEAVCGAGVTDYAAEEWERLREELSVLARKYQVPLPIDWPEKPGEGSDPSEAWERLEKARGCLLTFREKGRELVRRESKALEEALRKEAVEIYADYHQRARVLPSGVPVVVANLSGSQHASPGLLQAVADAFKQRGWKGILVLGYRDTQKASILVSVSKDYTGQYSAGTIVQKLVPLIGGRGGGRSDLAQGGGGRVEGLEDALSCVWEFLK